MAGVEYNYLRRAFGYPLAQLNFSIPDSLLSRIDLARPEYLDRKGFICLLIEKALTGSDTLVERREELPEQGRPTLSEASSTSTSTSKKVSKSNKEKGRKRAEVSPEFEVFWKTYQRCQKRVPSQSKAKAWEEWKKAIKHETPERITKALERAVYDAVNCDWDYKLPDCFRWLRDGRYSAVLEIPEAAVTNPKIVICDETF